MLKLFKKLCRQLYALRIRNMGMHFYKDGFTIGMHRLM